MHAVTGMRGVSFEDRARESPCTREAVNAGVRELRVRSVLRSGAPAGGHRTYILQWFKFAARQMTR
jgi:hypothetical protein